MFDDTNTFESLRPEMGVVESIIHEQWIDVFKESQIMSSRTQEMKQADATELTGLARVVKGFGTHKFNMLETDGIVTLDADRGTNPNASLEIDRNDATDLRNLLPVGEHEQYIDAITENVVTPEIAPILTEAQESELTMSNLRQTIDEQFALAA